MYYAPINRNDTLSVLDTWASCKDLKCLRLLPTPLPPPPVLLPLLAGQLYRCT